MEERVVVVTGASSGIGWAVAQRAARLGFRVVVAARREDRLQVLAAKIAETGGRVRVVPLDIAGLGDQRRLISETVDAFGRLDILVNNAGLPLQEPFAEAAPEDLQQQWNVNVTALATLTRLALPHLLERHGTVINIGSVVGRVGVPGWGNYSATKVAVAGLSDALRRELVPRGVHVCLVEPGPIATEFYERSGGPSNPVPTGSITAAAAARPIVRLFDHPRRRIVVPGWIGPFLGIMDIGARLLPPVVDAVIMRMTIGGRRPA